MAFKPFGWQSQGVSTHTQTTSDPRLTPGPRLKCALQGMTLKVGLWLHMTVPQRR